MFVFLPVSLYLTFSRFYTQRTMKYGILFQYSAMCVSAFFVCVRKSCSSSSGEDNTNFEHVHRVPVLKHFPKFSLKLSLICLAVWVWTLLLKRTRLFSLSFQHMPNRNDAWSEIITSTHWKSHFTYTHRYASNGKWTKFSSNISAWMLRGLVDRQRDKHKKKRNKRRKKNI